MNRRSFLRFLVAAPVLGPPLARAAVRAALTVAPKTGRIWESELAVITRRAFLPAMIAQTRAATPLLAALLAKGGHVAGGDGVVIPVAYSIYPEDEDAYDDEHGL